ncbi:hypothetical protein [Jannaschia sp. R86511]|uniref:hypothetical protein n=1 Tax=Jannaschia sp. R86511 TaxID=3093853 RepID=UPI0036D41070
MQADTGHDQTRDAVEDLDDLAVAVARLEATADALDARLTATAGAPGTDRA